MRVGNIFSFLIDMRKVLIDQFIDNLQFNKSIILEIKYSLMIFISSITGSIK